MKAVDKLAMNLTNKINVWKQTWNNRFYQLSKWKKRIFWEIPKGFRVLLIILACVVLVLLVLFKLLFGVFVLCFLLYFSKGTEFALLMIFNGKRWVILLVLFYSLAFMAVLVLSRRLERASEKILDLSRHRSEEIEKDGETTVWAISSLGILFDWLARPSLGYTATGFITAAFFWLVSA